MTAKARKPKRKKSVKVKVTRSAISGQFVTTEQGRLRPNTTVRETVTKPGAA